MDILRNAFNIAAEVFSYAPTSILLSAFSLAAGLPEAMMLLPLTLGILDLSFNRNIGPEMRYDLDSARKWRYDRRYDAMHR